MSLLRNCIIGLSLVLLTAAWSLGQTSTRTQRAAPPEEINSVTKDGVKLAMTYYRSTAGNEAVPIVMLHDYKEVRTVWDGLARALQSPTNPRLKSHAVLTVDLRGHGGSTMAVDGTGGFVEIDPSRLRPGDYRDMVDFDMEEVRSFLVERNDLQELNLNKLCLVGAGMGANVAMIWAAKDWDMPPLASRKQGQDVKALVLASPDWKQKGLPLVAALKHPAVQRQLSIMLVYGSEDSKSKESAETVYKNLKRFHPDPPIGRVRELKDLFDYPLPTTLQGSKLLVDQQFQMLEHLDNFLQARLVEQPFVWVQRK